jgi:hypothetical protein
MLYTVPIDYNSDTYEDSTVNGLYVYHGYGLDRSYELGADFTSISYTSGLDYKQQDYTFVYNSYEPQRRMRYGVHYITSDIDTYDGNVFFVGAGGDRDNGGAWNADLYVSQYSNMAPSLTAYQLDVGTSRTKPKTDTAGTFVITQVHVIRLGADMGLDDENFFSLEAAVTQYTDKHSITVFGWAGEQVFGVQTNGFAVFNKPEVQKGALGLTVGVNVAKDSRLTLGYARNLFQERYTGESSSSTRYTLMLGRTF